MYLFRNFNLLRPSLAAVFLIVPIVAVARTSTGVGFDRLKIPDPVNGGTMAGYVFYPSTKSQSYAWQGPYKLKASENASPISGAKPLVVISHGHGGSDLSHHDLATYLASHGFVVATLTHPKDNYRDESGNGHAVVEIGRPIQVSAVITYLLHSPRWKVLINPDQIGVAGFSAGGYTVLMLVGAVPQFNRLVGFCRKHPGDTIPGSICSAVKKLKVEAEKQGKTIEQAMGVLQHSLRRWGNTDDPRVKAAFVMAPFSEVFNKAGLSHVNRPVFLYYAQDDIHLRPKYNVLHIAPLIKTLAGIKMVPKAGHYVFLAPCTPELAKDAPVICQSRPGVNRVVVHRQINATALAFFRKTLKGDHGIQR